MEKTYLLIFYLGIVAVLLYHDVKIETILLFGVSFAIGLLINIWTTLNK